jgi:hypothetical protein
MKKFLFLTMFAAMLTVACERPDNANTNMANANMPPPAPTGECSQGGTEPTVAINTPTEAYKFLFDAVKSKDTNAIKSISSEQTRKLADFMSSTYKKSCEETYKNGFTETTFNAALPEMRDERIKDNFAALEVKRVDGQWEDLAFVKEGSGWKLALGDHFFGTFKSPGKGKAVLDQEAANAKMGNNMVPYAANMNANANTKVTVIDPMKQAQNPAQNPAGSTATTQGDTSGKK